MRRKSFEENLRNTVAPPKPQSVVAGLTAALDHGRHMHASGKLSDTERDHLSKHAAAERLNHVSDEDFDEMTNSGQFDRMRKLAGYEDGEDPDEVDAQRESVVAKVAVNMLTDAAHRGIIKPKEAIEAIRAYAALPDGAEDDPQGAIMSLLADSGTPDQPLKRPAGADPSAMSGDQAKYLSSLENYQGPEEE